MQPTTELLVPRPQTATPTDDTFELPARLDVSLALPDIQRQRALYQLTTLFTGHDGGPVDIHVDGETRRASVRLRLEPGRPESYRLHISSSGIEIVGGDDAGLLHGLGTLTQWIRLHGESRRWLRGLEVQDYPDFPHRGVLLDVSRDKVPRLSTLFALVDLLAQLKINQLQLYFEHTFAYRGHEKVWRDADPFTAVDIRQLDRYCSDRFIRLVPNQNSFGHFHRWLVHEPYRSLAEVPDGIDHPFSDRREPFGLCPTDPRSLELLADLYDQLLPHFTSRLFNVGLDETIDLGRGRSREAVEASSVAEVYLEFLKAVERLVSERGRRMLFFADIVREHPEIVTRLPDRAVALEWGYEADHPFSRNLGPFQAAGREAWVCPGTSSWNSFGGRLSNALGNLAAAAMQGHEAGSRGYLITDWGDFGHLQPLPISYPGFVAGASYAWNTSTAEPGIGSEMAALLDRHLFRDEAGRTGRVLCALGRVAEISSAGLRNSSALFLALLHPERPLDHPALRGLTGSAIEASREAVATALDAVASCRPEAADGSLVLREIEWTGRMMAFACDFADARLEAGGRAPGELPDAVRSRLRAQLERQLEEHEQIWIARNRPAGLADSQRRLRGLLATLAA